MRDAFCTYALGVLEAAVHHLFAGFVVVEVEAALAGGASEIIVGSAVVDCALVVVELERLIARAAGVVVLLVLAAQQIVMLALVQDQRKLNFAARAGPIGFVFLAVLDAEKTFPILPPKPVRTVHALSS